MDGRYADQLALPNLPNLRQIQNTIRTANTLAQEEGIPLERSHLEVVLGVGTAWIASRSRIEESRGVEETSRAEYPYRMMLIDFAIVCWKSWAAGVPGSFPDEMFSPS